MTTQLRSRERREVMATARRYRRDGYEVSGPDRWLNKPSFLGDIVPDLIAERDDDKVVIEIKDAAAVRGSNDIVEIAERVAKQPGWRFELIALRTIDPSLRPDLAFAGESVARLVEDGFLKPAYVMVYAAIENIIASWGAHRKRRPADLSPTDALKQLVVKGVIDQPTYDAVRLARARRNALMHNPAESEPERGDIEALLRVGSNLERAIRSEIWPVPAAG